MRKVNVTDLREHLPEYLKRASRGESVQVTVRGKVVAQLVAAPAAVEEALAKRDRWRKQVRLGDVITPLDLKWTADEDNL